MKVRRIGMVVKYSAQTSGKRGSESWVGMELSAEADLAAGEDREEATRELAQQLRAQLAARWREMLYNKNVMPAPQLGGNGAGIQQAPPITDKAHESNGNGPDAGSQDGGRDEEGQTSPREETSAAAT